MIPETDVLRLTHCNRSQLDTAAGYGLIFRHQVHKKGHRGSAPTLYEDDTVARMAIIAEVKREGLHMPEAAFELFLQGYDISAKAVRAALNGQISRTLEMSSFAQRRRTVDALPSRPSREQLTRRVTKHVDYLRKRPEGRDITSATLDGALISAYGAQGQLPRSMTLRMADPEASALVDGNKFWPERSQLWDYHRLREELQVASDEALLSAVSTAREFLAAQADDYVARLQTNFGLDPEDFIRGQLPKYHVKIRHTARQVMLPFMVLYVLDPIADKAGVASDANELFHVTLAPAMKEVADYLNKSAHR